MQKTIKSTGFIVKPKKIKVMIGDNSVVNTGELTNQIISTNRKNQVKTVKSKNLIKPKNHDFFSIP